MDKLIEFTAAIVCGLAIGLCVGGWIGYHWCDAHWRAALRAIGGE